MNKQVTCMLAAAALFSPLAAAAEVISVSPAGFEVRTTLHVIAAADKAYAMLLNPARWWDSSHTFSHAAANLTLEAHAGGCWCETLPGGGSVQHMSVLWIAPGQTLRLRGALGPLQAMAVDGVLTWRVTAAAGGSDIAVSYAVSGYSAQGFATISKGVDQVIAAQIGRLKKLTES